MFSYGERDIKGRLTPREGQRFKERYCKVCDNEAGRFGQGSAVTQEARREGKDDLLLRHGWEINAPIAQGPPDVCEQWPRGDEEACLRGFRQANQL